MRRSAYRWSVRFLRWLEPGLVAYGAFWGLNPPFEWFTERESPASGPAPGHRPSPGPGHPERLVPHVPLSPAERALWSQLGGAGATGVTETGRADQADRADRADRRT
ncbi:DUF6059 family protein [Kitasatospora sp. NPDC004240]